MKTITLFLSILLLGLTSCHNNKSNKGQSENTKKARFLQISFQNEVRSLDPSIGIDYPSAFAIKMLFDGLLVMGPDGKARPAVAEHYDVSSDHLTYTFHLRPTYWSNGDLVTAYDFEYNWKKIVDPQTSALGVENFYPIKNVRAIVCNELPLSSVGIKALDASTLQVELESLTPYFLEALTNSCFLPSLRSCAL